MEQRHAYLILCHNNYPVLEKLLLLLDDPRNDLYIHVDKKWKDFPRQQVEALIQRSYVEFIPRRSIAWGGYSMSRTEMDLIRAAVKRPHSYYHIFSGVTLPLKSQDEIHRFFAEHQGKEFIGTDEHSGNNPLHVVRIRYYYFLQERAGRKFSFTRKVQDVLVDIQRRLGVNRLKKLPYVIHKGAQWCSITHDLAMYLLENEKLIHKHFSNSVCADEVFIHTMAFNSRFADRVVKEPICYTDWDRGSPYTFTAEDYDELIAKPAPFARKFGAEKDMQIVDMLYERVRGK